MLVSHFDYPLPTELIALTPAAPRDASRLLVLDRQNNSCEHKTFRDIVGYLRPEDCLVLNDTRVVPARMIGRRSGEATRQTRIRRQERKGGGKIEVFLLRLVASEDEGRTALWRALTRAGWRVAEGDRMIFGPESAPLATGEVVELGSDGTRLVRITVAQGSFSQALEVLGRTPLPPYIRRPIEDADAQRYQTVYARENGAVAAPTAGLHFTRSLLEEINTLGTAIVFLTLHVGPGTFKPVKTDTVEAHRIHPEEFTLPEGSAAEIRERRARGGRIVAVGTTVTRAIETCADDRGNVSASSGETSLFIYPGYRFKAVDALVTNFHLPKSTLLMLAAAFAGTDRVRNAYDEAVRRLYRFYSYGDAMLIV